MSVMRALRAGIADEPVSLFRDRVGKSYLLVQKLYEGRETCVYLSTPADRTQPFALKQLRQSRRGDTNAHERIAYEAKILDRLEHPAIVRNFGHGQSADGTSFLVMEYVDGRDLAEIIERGKVAGFVTPSQILALGTACAAALVACHEGTDEDTELCITHGNLVPENIMLTPAGEIKLVDFGEATWTARDESSQIDPAEAGEARKDVRMLGLVLYQLVAGKSSLQSLERATLNPASIPSWVPFRLRRIIARTLETGSEPWYRNMRHLFEDLRELALAVPGGTNEQDTLATLFQAVRSPAPDSRWPTDGDLFLEDADEDPSVPYMSSTEVRKALRRSDEAALLTWLQDFELPSKVG